MLFYARFDALQDVVEKGTVNSQIAPIGIRVMCLQFRQQLMVVSLLGPLCYPRSHKPPTRPAPPLSLLLSLFFHVEQLVDIHLNSEVVYQNSTSFHFQGHILAIRHYGLDQGHVAGDKRLSVSLSGALVELWLPVFFFFPLPLLGH